VAGKFLFTATPKIILGLSTLLLNSYNRENFLWVTRAELEADFHNRGLEYEKLPLHFFMVHCSEEQVKLLETKSSFVLYRASLSRHAHISGTHCTTNPVKPLIHFRISHIELQIMHTKLLTEERSINYED
jgi:hypothetical protein